MGYTRWINADRLERSMQLELAVYLSAGCEKRLKGGRRGWSKSGSWEESLSKGV